jgi:hypothetical protein
MFQGGMDLILETISRTATPAAQRIATLDHEIRFHPMERQSIKKGLVLFLWLPSVGRIIFSPFSQPHETRYR